MKRSLVVTVALSLLIFSADAPAKMLYTWTDENGTTHITETPPPSTGRLKDKFEYTPRSRQEIETIRQEMQETREMREKERIQQLAREAQREASEAADRAEQARIQAEAAEKRLEEFKGKINNWRRYQKNKSTILELEAERNAAKERALKAAEEAQAAERRAEQAKERAEKALEPLDAVEAKELPVGEASEQLSVE